MNREIIQKIQHISGKDPVLKDGVWVYGENLVVRAGMPASGCTSRAVESSVDKKPEIITPIVYFL